MGKEVLLLLLRRSEVGDDASFVSVLLLGAAAVLGGVVVVASGDTVGVIKCVRGRLPLATTGAKVGEHAALLLSSLSSSEGR